MDIRPSLSPTGAQLDNSVFETIPRTPPADDEDAELVSQVGSQTTAAAAQTADSSNVYGIKQRGLVLASAASLVVSLVGRPVIAFGSGCSVQAAATALGDDIWIHAVAQCAGGVQSIRFFGGDTQIAERAGSDAFATWHGNSPAGP